MKNVLLIGGSSGLGLSLLSELLPNVDNIIVFDKKPIDYIVFPISQDLKKKVKFVEFNLFSDDFTKLKKYIPKVDSLIITAGFGRLAQVQDLSDCETKKLFYVNALSPIRIIKFFQEKIFSDNDFYTAVVGSIAGHIVSPLFSVYGAAKSSLSSFVSSMNVELIAQNKKNRILDISPGSIQGTSFYGKETNLNQLADLSKTILDKMIDREVLFIPNYESVYKAVLEKNFINPIKFGVDSYNYKISCNRPILKRQIIIGYLSGTFDLFHIGHLNLLKKAKDHCDYLIVGVHESGAWKGKETYIPFKERLEIVQSIKYVDLAVKSLDEDSDAWKKYHYDKLFVGSDYKGSERFKRYEEYFKNRNVEIIYFPYTKGTSSTQLRSKINNK